MSHTVTVTRTTTTTSTSAILLNVGYFRTLSGILKLFHIILGIIAVALVGNYIAYHQYQYVYRSGPNYAPVPDHGLFLPELTFLLIATAFLIGSILLLVSCVTSIATSVILAKTIYEIIYHFMGALLLLIASVVYICDIETEYQGRWKGKGSAYPGRLAAGVIGLVNTILYFVAFIFAYRGFKSG